MRNRKDRKRRAERIRLHAEKIRKTWKYAALPAPAPRPATNNGVVPPPVVAVPAATPAPATAAELLARAARVGDDLNALVALYRDSGYAPRTPALRRLVLRLADGVDQQREGQ